MHYEIGCDSDCCYRPESEKLFDRNGEELTLWRLEGLYDMMREQRKRAAEWGPDVVEDYWQSGITVWADHCVKCGRWAKKLAGCDWADWKSWRVTECSRCGIHDSRVENK